VRVGHTTAGSAPQQLRRAVPGSFLDEKGAGGRYISSMTFRFLPVFVASVLVFGCGEGPDTNSPAQELEAEPAPQGQIRAPQAQDTFQVEAERFADLRILRYRVPGFDELDLRIKRLLYYLYEASLSGREIIYDQKYRYNLAIKRTLEQIIRSYPGNRDTEDFNALLIYTKRLWFSNGIHHHYSNAKFDPGFSYEAFERYVMETPGAFPTRPEQPLEQFLAELHPVMFDPTMDAKLVDTRAGVDVVTNSAVNFYSGVTQQEVEDFYAEMRQADDPTPVSYGLNSRLVADNGSLVEQTWKVGGLYTEAIEQVVYWLQQAVTVAENDAQRLAFERLIEYYHSGDLEDWDDYSIAWVNDTDSLVDLINGFVEVYNDPIGLRGSFESVVSVRDPMATRRIDAIAREAQWFEDNSPIRDEHKKANVTGIAGRVINVVVEAGDASPATPIGINLPNSDWIRAQHGSKSVNLGNIVTSYDLISDEAEREFAWDADEIERGELYGETVSALMTDMHEVIGHASGQLNPGVAPLHETLKNYGSPIEEARADLVGLYYLIDRKLVEIGVLPSVEAGYIEYDRYIRGGLMTQLNRVVLGENVEEAHMRNRQMVASWAYEQGLDDNVIERRERNGETFFVVNDYDRLRELFGQLLRELQRIKSEGDFAAAHDLIETYGAQVDQELHAEVLERYADLDIPPYSGFINPRLVPIEENGEIVDISIEYPDDFATQMLEYADEYAFLQAWH
jgi:dipeptidyl-peptidase-3